VKSSNPCGTQEWELESPEARTMVDIHRFIIVV
jgi:hypothetical protein